MAYKPKADHAWRRYKNRKETGSLVEAAKSAPPLRNFLESLVKNWDTYEVPVEYQDEYVKLKSISDEKAAQWLQYFIKKNWTSLQDKTQYGR